MIAAPLPPVRSVTSILIAVSFRLLTRSCCAPTKPNEKVPHGGTFFGSRITTKLRLSATSAHAAVDIADARNVARVTTCRTIADRAGYVIGQRLYVAIVLFLLLAGGHFFPPPL